MTTPQRRRLRNHTHRAKWQLATPLTDEEIVVYADRAAYLQNEAVDKKEALRAHRKAAKAEVEEVERERNAILYKIRTRREDREVDVETTYHWRSNRVRTIRLDTGEVVEDRVMTHDERQTTIFDLEQAGVIPDDDSEAGGEGD